MKRISTIGLISIILYLVLFVHPFHVLAQEASIGIYPPIIAIKTVPPVQINTPFTVKNYTDFPIILELDIKNFKPSNNNDGSLEFVNTQNSIINHIQIQSEGNNIDQLVLGPQEQKTLYVKLYLSNDTPRSDYYFTILFTSRSSNSISPSGSNQIVQMGIATNVLLSVTSKSQLTGSIQKFTAAKLFISGPVNFTLLVSNTGSNFINPTGVILIKNMFGQNIGLVNLASVNILAHSSRYVPDSSLHSDIYAVWPEKFLLGIYSATVIMNFSKQGPTFTKSIIFLGVPYWTIFSVILLSLLIAMIIFRIKVSLKK